MSIGLEIACTRTNGRCAICGTNEPTAKGWHGDHDPYTLRFRGVRCWPCNIGLGAGDDAGLIALARLANMLDQSEAEQLGYDSDDPWTERPRVSLVSEPFDTDVDPTLF